MANIGITVTEKTDQGVPSILGSNDVVLGLVGQFERGPANKALLITGEGEFKRLFGGHVSGYVAAYAYTGYRANGGRNAYVTRVHGAASGVAATVTLTDGANTPLDTLTITAGHRSTEDQGTWGNSLTVTVTANLNDATLFDLTILLSGVTKEIWRGLTPATCTTALNDADTGSEFVKITNDASVTAAPDNNPSAQSATALSGGTQPDAAVTGDYSGDAGAATGFHAFTGKGITHMICPELQDTTTHTAMETYCWTTDGAITGIVSVPTGTAVSASAAVGTAQQVAISAMAMYHGWITVINPIGIGGNPTLSVPADGHVAGMYARTARARGVHKAPAGVIDGLLRGALGVDTGVITDAQLTTMADAGVNTIRSIPGYGICAMVARSLSKDTRWRYINVRNLFNHVKRAMRDDLLWVQNEPNDASLRRKVAKGVVLPFMLGLHRQGAFGSGSPTDTFTILCDTTNNTPAEIALGNFNLDLSMYPSRPAETIQISVAQQASGASSVSEG